MQDLNNLSESNMTQLLLKIYENLLVIFKNFLYCKKILNLQYNKKVQNNVLKIWKTMFKHLIENLLKVIITIDKVSV